MSHQIEGSRAYKVIECPDCEYELEIEYTMSKHGDVLNTADCPVCDEVIEFYG